MTRILHVATVDLTIQTLLMPLLKSLQAKGYSVEVACRIDEMQESIEREGIKIHSIDAFTRKMNPLSDIKAMFQLVLLLRREKFDIVHTHTPKPNLFGRLVSRLMGIPVIIGMEHGFYFHNMTGLQRRLFEFMSWLGAMCSDATIVINKDDYDLALRNKIIPVPRLIPVFSGLGVDLNRFKIMPDRRESMRTILGLPNEAIVAGFIGRISEEKGSLDLVYVAERVQHLLPNVFFLVVGPFEADMERRMKGLVEAKGLTRQFVFTGYRSDIPGILSAIDMLVLPTYREGLGMVLVESAAAGIPVITSHIRGCKDVVVDGVTGRLVSPKDIHGLAEAVTELAFDSDKRRRMGDAARRLVVERFDARYFHIEVDALYRRLLTEKRTTSNGS